jgi:hypothetical protein
MENMELNYKVKSPILLITYKRFETTKQVFDIISQVKPDRFYFVSNAPNPNNLAEIDKILKVRNLLKEINWECDVKVLLRETHLQVRDSIPDAIDWFFETEVEGIILEDDCLPNFSFFRFCDELLDRFRDVHRVSVISGTNFDFNIELSNQYYFSNLTHIWGWATWKRSWVNYDRDILYWPHLKSNNFLSSIFKKRKHIKFWESMLDGVYQKKINTWDFQLALTYWYQNQISIVPRVNLISNIGVGIESTNAHYQNSFSSMKTVEMKFPLEHNNSFVVDTFADNKILDIEFSYPSILTRILNKLRLYI